MNWSTTEKNWLSQFTTRTKVAMEDALKIRKRVDFEGWEPPDVKERREMNRKLHEHDSILAGIKRGIMNMAGAFDKKK